MTRAPDEVLPAGFAALKRCKNCTGPFTTPASAQHKIFCSDGCRMEWHGRQRAEAMRLFRQAQDGPGTPALTGAEAPKQEDTNYD